MTAVPPIVAWIVVAVPAVTAVKVAVYVPLLLSVAGLGLMVPALVPPLALKTTASPPLVRLLPFRSLACKVSVTVPPDCTVPAETLTVDVATDAAPGVTVTLAVCVMASVLIVAETVLLSALVELSVPVATPFAFVFPAGCVSVFPVPVADSTTALLGITFPNPSRAVTVTVAAAPPATIELGDAVTEDCGPFTAPGRAVARKLTGEPTAVARALWVLSVGVTLLPNVQLVVAIPEVFVVDVGGLTVPPPPVTAHVTETPDTGLFSASATLTDRGTESVAPTVSAWPSPPFSTICVAPPTVAVMLKVTVVGTPPSVAVAVVVCMPAVGPSVRTVVA